MVVDPTVVADSARVAVTAPSVSFETTDATHGEQTDATPESAEAQQTDEHDDDDAEGDDSSEDLSEEETKTRAEKRRERRRAREEERIARAVQERMDQAVQTRVAKATADKAEADTRAAAENFYKEFGSFVGTPETRTALDQEISALTAEVTQLRPYAEGTDLDALEQKQTALAEKVAERNRLNANQSTYDKLDAFQFRLTQNQYVQAGSDLPKEFQTQLLGARDVPSALKAIKEGYMALGKSQEAAAKDKQIAEWQGRYEK